MSESTTALNLDLDIQVARENIAWWEDQRQEHLRKRETIGARRCQEEIGLWQQEINELETYKSLQTPQIDEKSIEIRRFPTDY